MLKNAIKTAWRNIVRNKSTSIINITGLSIAMTAAILILLWVQNEMSFDSYHPSAERIYHIRLHDTKSIFTFSTPGPLTTSIRSQLPDVEKITEAVQVPSARIFSVHENYFKERKIAWVDKEWFSLFKYDFIQGNPQVFNLQKDNIILTSSLARKFFGTAEALGQRVKMDSLTYTVTGIIKDNPINSSLQFAIFLPIEFYRKTPNWKQFDADTYLLATKDATIGHIEKGINQLLASNETDTMLVKMTALKSMHFDENYSTASQSYGAKKIVYIFSILGLLLLCIACINYVNLSTAQASSRGKEVGIKKIMGAGIKNLFIQFMIESVVTSVLALLLTLVLVWLSLPWFNTLTDKVFILSLQSAALWEVLVVTLLLTIILTGFYPALLLSSFKPLNVLKGMNVLKLKNASLRKTLVTVQFTIAIALAICSIVILKQMHFIQHTNEGYERSEIFSFQVPGSFAESYYARDKTETYRLMKAELTSETAIAHVTVSNEAVQNITMSMSGIADWQGKKKDDNTNITLLTTDPDFRNIFKLQLKEGRWFQGENDADKHNYILNETAVTALGLKPPYLGQFFAVMNDTGRIIGVVKDFHFRNFHEKITASVLFNNPLFKGTFFVEASPSKMKDAIAKTEATFRKFFPTVPFEYNFMDADFDKMYKSDIKTSKLVGSFSAIAIFISCLGLFGLISFVAVQRTKEIGIRKVLGATVSNIALLLSKDFIKLVAIAIFIASPIAFWAMNKWLEAFAYRIDLSWWMFGLAGISAIVVALITVSLQALKAATANPVKALRNE